MTTLRTLTSAIALAACLAACANLPKTKSTTVAAASPTPTVATSAGPGAIPSPAPCGAQGTNAVYVAMSSTITATSDPTYGTISGYALADSSGNPGTTTAPIILKPNDVA